MLLSVAGGVPVFAAAHAPHQRPPLRTTGNETVLYAFDRPGVSNPTASLIVDANGTLYGTAGQGGNGGNPSEARAMRPADAAACSG